MEPSSEDFNPLVFEKRLTTLKDTQDSIQNLSTWCLHRRQHHKKIVSSWLNVLKRVKVEQRLTLFYLANDVIQYSKRKNYEFVESWGTTLQKATPLVRDDKVKHRILRIFKIWEQRMVYDEEFLTDLTGLLSAGAGKRAPDDDPNDFQPSVLVNKIKQCAVLEADTDLRLKHIHECHLSVLDADALCANLKDRRNTDDVQKELDDVVGRMEKYKAALQREIVAREALCAILTTAHNYYDTQRGEVKVVANAYKNFGARVRGLKRKLDELMDTLPSAPEPEPEPEPESKETPEETSSLLTTPPRAEDVPSPGPDEDLDLPQNESDTSYNLEKTFSASILGDGGMFGSGFSSFLGGNNPFNFYQDSQDKTAIAKTIELASTENSREEDSQGDKTDFNINDFFKAFVPDSTANNSTAENDSSYEMVPPPPPPPLLEYSPPPVPAPIASSVMITNTNNIPLLGSGTDILPGLELLTPSSEAGVAPVPPPAPFYGSRSHTRSHTLDDTGSDIYNPETDHSWTMNNWETQPILPVPPVLSHPIETVILDTPESPPSQDRNDESVDPVIPHDSVILNPQMADIDHRLHPQSVDIDHRQLITPQVSDVDHRSLLPPPPLPPALFPLTGIGDVDHRGPPPPPPIAMHHHTHAHRNTHQDIDHRNLISLTTPSHQISVESSQSVDQDYRLPPPPLPPTVGMVPPPSIAHLMVPPPIMPNPSDIVESVDMDLSEDEEMRNDIHYGDHQISPDYGQPPPTFQYNQPQSLIDEVEELMRPFNRQFSNNNKVLVGGDTPERQEPKGVYQNSPNLVRINSIQKSPPSPAMHEPLLPITADAPFDYKKVTGNLESNEPSSINNNLQQSTLPPNLFEVKLSEDIEAFSNASMENTHGAQKLIDDSFDTIVSPVDILRNPSPPLVSEHFMMPAPQEWAQVVDNSWHLNPPPRMVNPRPHFMNQNPMRGAPRHFGNYRYQHAPNRGGPWGNVRQQWRPNRPPRGYW